MLYVARNIESEAAASNILRIVLDMDIPTHTIDNFLTNVKA
jgi:hypothetical protein